MILSLFCGPGGLDLGFENAGFNVGLAFDIKPDSVATYNANRAEPHRAHLADVSALTLDRLDELWGAEFNPDGVIGGPPCQSFSQANTTELDGDPRHLLPLAYAGLLKRLNKRRPVKFFVMENVTGLTNTKHLHRLMEMIEALTDAGYNVSQAVLNGIDYGLPQKRQRLFLVGISRAEFPGLSWQTPSSTTEEGADISVKAAIGGLPEPTYFRRDLLREDIPFHPNHWCMSPKSPKFTKPGALMPGNGRNRSFKTLAWEKPSPTVAYGHREVHVHPSCTRRLSVYEAMKLQGFPDTYELLGTLSSQIIQVSEAVPPPMAEAVARSVKAQLDSYNRTSAQQAA